MFGRFWYRWIYFINFLLLQFQAALLQRWVLAYFMCSLAPFVQVISVNVSIFTLSVIAVDRYIAVIHPFKAGCSKRSAAIIISVIWAVGIGAAVPVQRYFWVDYIEDGNVLIPWCSMHPPEEWKEFPTYYYTMLVCVQYILPLIVITYCYCRIAWHIWGSRRPGAHVTSEDVRGRNKRKVSLLLVLMCARAFVCMYVLILFINVTPHTNKNSSLRSDRRVCVCMCVWVGVAVVSFTKRQRE